MSTDLLLRRSAVVSHCALFRYRLERDLGRGGKTVAGIMVNPSTADATIDDHTIRKWFGFAERLGAGRFIIGNKFAFRSKDVDALRTAELADERRGRPAPVRQTQKVSAYYRRKIPISLPKVSILETTE